MRFIEFFITNPQTIVAICQCVALISIIVVTIQLINIRKTTRHQVYGKLDDNFISFIKLAADNADLRLHALDDDQIDWYSKQYNLERSFAIKELMHYALLFSLWEHAFMNRRRKWMDKSQWIGWHNWIKKEYFIRHKREEHGGYNRYRIIDAWFIAGRTFDEYFEQYIADIIRDILNLPDSSLDSYQNNFPPEPWPGGFKWKDTEKANVAKYRRFNKKINPNYRRFWFLRNNN
jgi:hypothetical protein